MSEKETRASTPQLSYSFGEQKIVLSPRKEITDSLKAKDAAKTKPKEEKFKYENVDVISQGTQIILPEGMDTADGITCLQRRLAEDEKACSIHEEVDAFPLEGAYAFMCVLRQIFGWATPVPKKTFFGEQPPTMVSLEIGVNKHVQVVWGQFMLPGIEGVLATGAKEKDGRPIFVIAGEVKQKYKAEVSKIAQAVRDFIKENSIYRGKAIRLRTDEDGDVNFEECPKFIDTTKTDPSMLIFAEQTLKQINTHIFTPIMRTKDCKKFHVPLKRSVLLEGPFGTGKTLTAHVAAHLAENHGWTFIYLDRVSALQEALIFARQYGPAVIFAEDIDRIASGERTVEVDDILNTIDGIDGKHDETLVILTTNDVQKIEKAMIRPGRLDAVIHVGPPDAKAAEKLIRVYAEDLLPFEEDLTLVGEELSGQIPATIAEVVKRSKLYAIAKSNGQDILQLTAQDIFDAALGMKDHMALLYDDAKKEMTAEELLGTAMAQVVQKHVNGNVTKCLEESSLLKETHEKVMEM